MLEDIYDEMLIHIFLPRMLALAAELYIVISEVKQMLH